MPVSGSSSSRGLSVAWSWLTAIISGPAAALLGLYFLYLSAQDKPISPPVALKVTFGLFVLAFPTSLIAGFRAERRRADEAEARVKALTESTPRIVYVGQRSAPLVERRPGTDGHHVQYAFHLLHLRFKNRPVSRVGEASVARRVTATVEFFEDKRDELITRFEGRWPVTTAADHVGYERTEPTADFEANEFPVKLNLAVIPGEDGRVYAASEENFHANPAGDHPAHRINPLQDEDFVRVRVKLRGSNVNQDFWFRMKFRRHVPTLTNTGVPLEIEVTSGEYESEFLES